MNIFSNQENPCVNAVLEFPLYGNIADEIKGRLDYIDSILAIFEEQKDEAKLNFDISYSASKNFNVTDSVLKNIFLEQGYENIRIDKEKCRKFKVIDDHNITSVINLKQSFNGSTDFKFGFDVENIVIDLTQNEDVLKNIKEEINCSILYYITEYIKIHYNIIKNIDENYFQKNLEFYKSIESQFKLK